MSADTKTMMRMINSELDDMMQKQVFNGQHENPPGIDDPNERLAKQAEKMSDQEILELPIPGNTSVEKRRNLRAILANSKNSMLHVMVLLFGYLFKYYYYYCSGFPTRELYFTARNSN